MFKSQTMNALVVCGLLDDGFGINESIDAVNSWSLILEEGKSGELYQLVLSEGSSLHEGSRTRTKREGRAITRADKANRQRNQAQQRAEDERTHGEAETSRADAAEAGKSEAEASRSRVEKHAQGETEKRKRGGEKAFAAGKKW